MQIKLTNVVDNTVRINSDFIPSNGLSYLIEFEDRKMLFDAGDQGIVLIHNMKYLDIDPKSIDLAILSHGHWDHTFGIEALMYARGEAPVLNIIAHPHAIKKRRLAKFWHIIMILLIRRRYNFGFPKLTEKIKDKLHFTLVTQPYELTPFLTTTGEISEWKEKHCKIDKLTIKLDDKYVKDDILDDLSLVLKTKEGLVLILGCGHAGVLNICARAKEIHPNNDIKMIIGGTHLVALTEEKDLEYVAKILEKEYNKPTLYFSHCTGKKATDYLRKRFGKDTVRSFNVSDELTFDI
ncbi:MAG: MBL fold metallo-hydrolase [Candidatus Heimdallarchaeota archaeon]|nr:MBL fold metallo-hydrolase [Candidatus Heimdallarchaeota archaeon]MCK4954452.1 MBL fold metallo-hydrolase [Candidatus Heimdallarchaeota archaeon]